MDLQLPFFYIRKQKIYFFYLQQRLIIVLKKERVICKRYQQVFNKEKIPQKKHTFFVRLLIN